MRRPVPVLRVDQRTVSAGSTSVHGQPRTAPARRRAPRRPGRAARCPSSACARLRAPRPRRWTRATRSPRSYGTQHRSSTAGRGSRASIAARSSSMPGAGAGRHEDRLRPGPLEPQQRLLVGRVDLVDDQQLGHARRRRPRRAPRGPPAPAPPGRDGRRRPRARPGRPGRPPPASSGTPRRSGAAGAGRSRPCRRACRPAPSRGRGPPGGRVERGEQRVLDQHAGAGQPVEQAGLAGVGVAGDGHGGHRVAARGRRAWSRRTVRMPLISRAQPGDAGADPPPVGLELGLTGTAQAHAAAGAAAAAAPPAWRDSASPQPRSRGSRYCSWASSTCALPSLLLACWAKMSRISAVRSMTLTLICCSRLRSWDGRELAVADHRVGAGRLRPRRAARRPCRGR